MRRRPRRAAFEAIKIELAALALEGQHHDFHRRGAVVADHRQLVGQDVFAHDRLFAAGGAFGHPDRGGRRLRPVDGRDVDHLHVEQLGHQGLVLEQELEAPVVLVGLAGIGAEDLGAGIDLVADGRNVVLVAARAEEVYVLLAGLVLLQHAGHGAVELILRADGLWHVEAPVQPQLVGHVAVQLLDRGDADKVAHLPLDRLIRVRDVGVMGKFMIHIPCFLS